MPLRDHFRPPLTNRRRWEAIHSLWPAVIVQHLVRWLPPQYHAEPRVHQGASVEIDVATYEYEGGQGSSLSGGTANGPATAVWAPPQPTATAAIDLPVPDLFEVRVYDEETGLRLVAAVELVSPRTKDRPESRNDFVIKCASLLQQGISLVIIDLVTEQQHNLHAQFLQLLRLEDPAPLPEERPLYAVAYRPLQEKARRRLDLWIASLVLGTPLPTLPLWLTSHLAVPLELETSYEETCRVLRIV